LKNITQKVEKASTFLLYHGRLVFKHFSNALGTFDPNIKFLS